MRGGSQAHEVEAEDGHSYAAKFQNNPQGTRTLVNEWIAHWFLRKLGITTPEIRCLRLSQAIIEQADLHFQLGCQTSPVVPGLHFGSQFPANPETAIFDFLPRRCLHLTTNLEDFGRALVLDTLLGQTDSRQAVFVRDRGLGTHKLGFRAYLIDYGLIFGGDRWTLEDRVQSRTGIHDDVYSLIALESICDATVAQLNSIASSDLLCSLRYIPREWLSADDHRDLEALIKHVFRRMHRLETLVQSRVQMCVRAPQEPRRESTRLRASGS